MYSLESCPWGGEFSDKKVIKKRKIKNNQIMKLNLFKVLLLSLLIYGVIAHRKVATSQTLTGGFSDVDLSNPGSEFKEIDEYVRNHFKEECKNLSENVILKQLTRAQQQVVAGMNYRLTYNADGYS